MIRPWPKVSTKPLGDFRIFSIRSDEKISPRTGLPHDFFIIDCVHWVNIIAVTPENELIMVEQYRHGSNTVELEVPGGTMDPSDSDPVATAVRELREETGYEGRNARILGQIYPNPAIMSNICYTVLIEDCRLRHQTQLDSGEDLITRLVPADELPSLIKNGKIQHSLVVVGLYYYDLFRRGTV